MSSLDDADVQELVDQITENQSERPEEIDKIKKAIENMHQFLDHETEKDELGRITSITGKLYQYEAKNQIIFNQYKQPIDDAMGGVYDMQLYLTKASYKIASTPDEETTASDKSKKEMTNQNQKGIFESLQEKLQPKIKTVAEAVEDPYKLSQDMILKTKNIPNLWNKFVELHETNLLRDDAFEGNGMEQALRIERWYFRSKVVPNISTLITAYRDLKRTTDTERVAKVLNQYYTQKEKHRMDMPT